MIWMPKGLQPMISPEIMGESQLGIPILDRALPARVWVTKLAYLGINLKPSVWVLIIKSAVPPKMTPRGEPNKLLAWIAFTNTWESDSTQKLANPLCQASLNWRGAPMILRTTHWFSLQKTEKATTTLPSKPRKIPPRPVCLLFMLHEASILS